MRLICFSVIFTLLTFFKLSAEPVMNKTEQVEQGLRHPVRFVGDFSWSIEERMKHYGIPGVSIAVIENYKISWAKGYGVTDRKTQKKVTTQTLFQAASLSKPVSAYGVLKLVEQGNLQLDEAVNQQMISWQIPKNDLSMKQPVTIRHLLSHSGGLTVHGFAGYEVGNKIPNLIEVFKGESPANNDAIEVNILPGSKFRYSGGGYTILQQIMMDVQGGKFSNLMDLLVLKPIGMASSTYNQPLSSEKLTMAASGYLPDKTPVKDKHHIYPEMAAAGLWTTASDYARFVIDVQLSLNQDNGQVLSQSTVRQMTTPSLADMGLGFFLQKKGSETYFFHGGWNAGFCSFMTGHPSGIGVVVMINSNHPQFMLEVINGVAEVYDWPKYLLPTFKPIPFTKEEFDRISGSYDYLNIVDLDIFEEDGKVFAQYSGSPKNELLKTNENEYYRREEDVKISFVETENNKNKLVYLKRDGTEMSIERAKFSFLRLISKIRRLWN